MAHTCNWYLLGILIFLCTNSISLFANEKELSLGNHRLGWKAILNSETGTLTRYDCFVDGKWEIVPFRNDNMSGPSWEGIQLKPVDNQPYTFSGTKEEIVYSLSYKEMPEHLIVECSITNLRKQNFVPERSRLILGVNSEMKTFPDWDNKFFPTLLRCEKDFAWGYFMSPKQVIMAVGVEEPVASYALNYIYEGWLKWKWGHQIKTASFDMLHCLPLPSRHPQNLSSLKPNETKRWTLHLGAVSKLSEVKNKLSTWTKAPYIHCSKYTLSEAESTNISVYSHSPIKEVVIINPKGGADRISFKKQTNDLYRSTYVPSSENGLYLIKIMAANGKTAEASIYVRKPWSWYMKNARDFVTKNPPLFSNGCEAFYGYYTSFLAARHFPDKVKDSFIEERFNRTLPFFIDTITWIPKANAAPDRVQNFSALTGMLVDLWEATGNISYLEKASKVGDYICSEKVQTSDGAYRSKGIHYTAVIYPAKSMLELVVAEKTLADHPKWKERYERHLNSAERAIKDLLLRLDDIQTEGDLTLEDGMVTCSALQLALQGLQEENENKRHLYTAAAQYMMDKHQCLEQLLIPDCRMNGATLRYWEALDVYFVPNQVMNSPHGWTAWKIYANYYLYLLTGEVRYLSDFMNTLGSCAQIMELNGNLRWGFIPDPYIAGKVCVEMKEKKHHWQPMDSIVGEQYLDMISPWLRPDDENSVCAFKERGGAGDNTVQEIFKAMEECALTAAYVVIDEKGQFQTWNCIAKYQRGKLCVYPNETIVSGVHINAFKEISLEVVLPQQTLEISCFKGMKWFGNAPSLIK